MCPMPWCPYGEDRRIVQQYFDSMHLRMQEKNRSQTPRSQYRVLQIILQCVLHILSSTKFTLTPSAYLDWSNVNFIPPKFSFDNPFDDFPVFSTLFYTPKLFIFRSPQCVALSVKSKPNET